MAKALRMPSVQDLPKGGHRDFVAHIFRLYREAGRPTLRDIEEQIKCNHDLKGTASKETVRRVLQGKSVPPNWITVEAIVETLCAMAGINPDVAEGFHEDEPSAREFAKIYWNGALDADPASPSWPGLDDDPPF